MLVCLMTFAGKSFAQNHEYPHYGFWSNWGVGVTGSLNWQLDQDFTWGAGFDGGMGITLEQKMNHVWDFRMRFNYPTFFKNAEYNMDNHAGWTVDMKFSINNAFKGYDPNRKGSLYLFGGAGLGFSFNNYLGFGHVGIMLDGGLGYSYKVCEKSSLFAELECDVTGDAPRPSKDMHHTNVLFNLGYMYHFGITAADRELAAQRALLTQERFENLNSQAESLKKELAESKTNEEKLENKVAETEAAIDEAVKNALANNNSAAADSLQSVIDQLKADQLTYYAMPFSVLFENDSYQVPDSELVKIQAIARIMKDNPDVKITIVGFCDYTGSDAYNMKLSKKRAEEVKRVMVKKYGVDGDRLDVDYKGKTIAYGDLKFTVNRRVSFYRVIE